MQRSHIRSAEQRRPFDARRPRDSRTPLAITMDGPLPPNWWLNDTITEGIAVQGFRGSAGWGIGSYVLSLVFATFACGILYGQIYTFYKHYPEQRLLSFAHVSVPVVGVCCT